MDIRLTLAFTVSVSIVGLYAMPVFSSGAEELSATPVEQELVSLSSLIKFYQLSGYKILYSSRVVNKSMQVNSDLLNISPVNINDLAAALPELGLQLLQQQSVYVITPNTDDPATVPKISVAQNNVDPLIKAVESIIVTGSMHKYAKTELTGSSRVLAADQLNALPAIGFDAIRLTNRLPGSSSMGVSARPRIRGGLQDELLVLQDGIELLEPFHLADFHSAYSAIDLFTVDTIEVYTGGFPSRYGNRMSGVLDITSEGFGEENATSLGISNFSQFVNTSQALTGDTNGAWTLAYRRGDLSDLTQYIEAQSGVPRYYDASARLLLELNDKRTLSFGAVVSRDKIKFEDAEEKAGSRVRMKYGWVRLEQEANPDFNSSWSFNYIDFVRQKSSLSLELPDETEDNPEPEKGGFLDYQQKIRRFAVRNDYSSWLASGRLLEFGWQAEYTRGEFDNHAVINRGELADLLGTQKLLERDLIIEENGWSGGAYASMEYELIPGLIIQPSMRWDFQTYYSGKARYQVSPRLGMAYEISEKLDFRFSIGRFFQPEALHELQILDGETEYFAAQKSDHFVLGLDWQSDKVQFVADIYYKNYRNQKRRYENIFNPFVLLPELEPDRVGISPGRAFARGIDLDFAYLFSPELNTSLRYSYMSAKDRLNGVWVPRRWSQTHTVNGSLVWQKNDYTLAAAATWHSGWRTSHLEFEYDEDTVLSVENILNNRKLGTYFSFDISARKHWDVGKVRIEVFGNITNVSDRKNRAGIDYDIDESDEGTLLLTPDPEFLPGLIPSIGISLSF